MKKDKTLLTYILGGITILTFIPIIESITEIICGYLELLKISSTKEVLRGNKEIQELQNEQEELDAYAIGFDLTPQEEYYEDDDEYFDD